MLFVFVADAFFFFEPVPVEEDADDFLDAFAFRFGRRTLILGSEARRRACPLGSRRK